MNPHADQLRQATRDALEALDLLERAVDTLDRAVDQAPPNNSAAWIAATGRPTVDLLAVLIHTRDLIQANPGCTNDATLTLDRLAVERRLAG